MTVWLSAELRAELPRWGVDPADLADGSLLAVGVAVTGRDYLEARRAQWWALEGVRELLERLSAQEKEEERLDREPAALMVLPDLFLTSPEALRHDQARLGRRAAARRFADVLAAWKSHRAGDDDTGPQDGDTVDARWLAALPPRPDATQVARVRQWLWGAWRADENAESPHAESSVTSAETQAELLAMLHALTDRDVLTLARWAAAYPEALWKGTPPPPLPDPDPDPEAVPTEGQIAAFLHGCAQARETLTARHETEDERYSYDLGRELAHRVTRRLLEPF